MRFKNGDDALIVTLYLLSCIMLLGQLMSIEIVTSIAFALSFLLVAGIWVLHLNKISSIDILAIFIVAISLICAMITCQRLTLDYFKNWWMFSSVFLYFSVCLKIKLKEKTFKTLFAINFMLSIACVLTYLLRYDEAFYITHTGVKYLQFNFYNPNVLALFLTVIAVCGIVYLVYYNVKFRILKLIIYIAIFGFLISETLSRTSLITFVFFVIISAWFVLRRHYFLPRSRFFNVAISVFPLFFAVFYLFMIERANSMDFLSFLISEGKDIDSRQYVWKYAFDLFKSSPFAGSYGYVMSSSEFSQMHNSHLNVLVSYGAVVFLLVVVFLYKILMNISVNRHKTFGALAVWSFVICIVLGSGESILFSGGLSFYLLTGQFLLFSNIDSAGKEGLK